MPHWNCERCGARLYSASKSLKRNECPVCQGRIVPVGELPARFGRDGRVGESGEKELNATKRSVDAGPA